VFTQTTWLMITIIQGSSKSISTWYKGTTFLFFFPKKNFTFFLFF